MSDSVRFQHFEVLRKDDGSLFELGRGAMGITYKAFDTNLRCFVALKVINATYLNSEIARQRFLREARAAAALRHPNVATVFHLGSEEDNYFYAMEFIDGDTVEAFMKREGAIPPPMALEIASQVGRALGAAQKQNLVHRDIKPSNLMFVREDGGDEFTVKVIDFGLAKSAASGEDTASLTGGGFLGTPHFASPEQLEERELDVRSDIYSLGVTLWYMLAGKTPFGGSLAQVMSQHLHREPPFETLEGQHPVVLKLLRRMMAKDPADRPQTPAELRREIEACMEVVKTLPTVSAAAPVSGDDFETEMAATIMTDGGPVEPAAGVVLAGRYRLLEEAPASDHGRMFRAEQVEEKSIVGVLILNTNLLATSEAFTRLEREVEAIQKLRHPSFQRILSLEHANGETFVVVEWVDTPSLLDLLRGRKSLTVGEAVRILAQLADAFDELRGSGLNCPDIGAHEVMLPGGDLTEAVTAWKVCTPKFTALTATGGNSSSPDATMVASSFAMMKATGAFAGNPPAAYVYAVAALAYEMLGGVRASGSTSNYVPIPGLSEEGNAILRKGLNPAQGFTSARVLVDELAEEDSGAKPVIVAKPPPIPATMVPKDPEPAVSASPVKKGKSPVTMILLSVAGVLAAFLGVMVIFLGAQKKKPAEATPVVAQATPAATPEAMPESTPEATPEPVDPQVKAYQDGLAAADALQQQDKVSEAILAYAELAKQFPQEKQPHVVMEQLTARALMQQIRGADFESLRPALIQAADLNVMSAQMLVAERLQKTDPATALKYFIAAAQNHRNSYAMVQVGLMYSNGSGVAVPDAAEAKNWFTKAEENGSGDGRCLLAEMLLKERNPENYRRVAELLTAATVTNNVRAMNILGDLYRRGLGDVLKPDVKESFRLHTMARDLGSADASGYLGVLYFSGAGLPDGENKPNPREGVRLMKEGAEAGSAMSMAFYAQCLMDGEGTEKNEEEAKRWYVKAAKGGNKAAMEWCKKNNIPLAN